MDADVFGPPMKLEFVKTAKDFGFIGEEGKSFDQKNKTNRFGRAVEL
jgi:hypothetical protein